MREMVLSKSFVQSVQEFARDNNLLDIVQELAMSIDQLSGDLAEQMIYHMLITQTLVGMDFDSEEINLALSELWRIREGKGDMFKSPTVRWDFLKNTEEFNAMSNCVKNPLEFGLVMNTIAVCLKKPGKVRFTLPRMERVIEKIDQNENAMFGLFSTALMHMCEYGNFTERYDYLSGMGRRGNRREFVKSFAGLFIMMANEPMVYEALSK